MMRRIAICLILVVSACGDAAEPAATTAPPTTVAPTTVAPTTSSPTSAAPTTTTFPCPVTIPDGSFEAPEGYATEPTGGVWYGTPELWTVLSADGSYSFRKSVWWSINFPGGRVEEQPEIAVTWRQLDGDAVHEHPAPGTNAYTPEDGDFMIAGIDPMEPGCWEVTATYKGAELTYVYEQN